MIPINALKNLVLIHQTELARLTPEERSARVDGTAEWLSVGAQPLLDDHSTRASKERVEALDKIALGLAHLSMQPGGVDLFGVHWEYRR